MVRIVGNLYNTESSLNKLSYHHYHPRDSNAEGSNKSFLEKVRVKESTTTSVTKQDTPLTLTITFMMQCCITLLCFLDWLLYEECFNFFSKSLGKSCFSLKLCNQKQDIGFVSTLIVFSEDTVDAMMTVIK